MTKAEREQHFKWLEAQPAKELEAEAGIAPSSPEIVTALRG